MSRLLLVEDDRNLTDGLVSYLSREGFEVCHAATLSDAATQADAAVEVVVLDWMLPDGAGIDLLRKWRQQGWNVPVIMLTARTDLVDRVVGLEIGANDYMTKPFEPRELLARLRVQLRTAAPSTAPESPAVAPSAPAEPALRCGPLEIRSEAREVRFRGQPVELSRQEYALLEVLASSPNRVFSRHELLNKAWGYEHYPSTRTVDTHVLQLRQKTDAALIETVRGIGYRLMDLTEN